MRLGDFCLSFDRLIRVKRVLRFNCIRYLALLAGVRALKAKLWGRRVVAHFQIRLVCGAHARLGHVFDFDFQRLTERLRVDARDVGLKLPSSLQIFGEQDGVVGAAEHLDNELAVVAQRSAFDFNTCPVKGLGA